MANISAYLSGFSNLEFILQDGITVSSNLNINWEPLIIPEMYIVEIKFLDNLHAQIENVLGIDIGVYISPAFGYLIYNDIKIKPFRIDVGQITSNIEYPIEIWNTFSKNITLLSIDGSNTDGILLTGQLPTPLIIGPWQSIKFILNVTSNGPSTINAVYLFKIDSLSYDALLTIVGRRGFIFGFCPDWTNGVSERLEWLTEILESNNGLEQRISLRNTPRRFIEYSFLLDEKDSSSLNNLLVMAGGVSGCLPIWTDVTVVNYEIPIGTKTITVNDRVNKDYQVNGLIVLWLSNTHCEVFSILSFSGDEIILKNEIKSFWPVGTRIFPGKNVRFVNGNINISRVTDSISIGDCHFVINEINDHYVYDYGVDYRNYKVFNWAPDRSEDIDDSWKRKLEIIDYNTGGFFVDDVSKFPKISHKLTWLIHGRQNIYLFKAWLFSRSGKEKPFWLSTFESDLNVTQKIEKDSNNLIVDDVGYGQYGFPSQLRNNISIKTTSGVFYREIVNVNKYPDNNELLIIDSPLGVDLNADQFLQVSYLELVRLDNDSIEFFWETDNICRVQFLVRVLRL